MIKKFKNWYNNLLSFQKTRFWQVVLGIVAYFLSFYLFELEIVPLFSPFYPLFSLFIALAAVSVLEIIFRPDDQEMTYKLKKMFKDSEDKINVWFDSACSDCVKVNIKPTENSAELAEILAYYHNKHLLVNSFYVERKKSILDKETIYYIYAKCEGKQDKVVFPDKITNAGYILSIFTLAN